MSLTNEELFQKLATQLDVPVETIQTDFNQIVEEVKKDERFTTADPKTIDQIARNKLTTRKNREAKSPAITWEGVFLGAGKITDFVAKQIQFTDAAYKADPSKPKQNIPFQGKIIMYDEAGTPLYPQNDVNDKWKRTATPLPKTKLGRTIYGVASPIDKKTRKVGEPKPFAMSLRDARSKYAYIKAIPKNKPIRFKGIDKTRPEDASAGIYNISDSALTDFKEAPDLKLPPIETIISSACGKKYEPLGNLEEYHAKNQNDFNRWVITEGNVSDLNLEPNPKTQNLRMVLDDETLLFSKGSEGRTSGVTCWIPNDRGIEIDFAQESRVYVLGQTSQGKKMDPVTKQKTDEPGDVMLNVFGIYCPEMFKVKPLEPVPANALEPTAEPSGEDW